MRRVLGIAASLALVLGAWSQRAGGQEYEQEPILYGKATPDNRVSRLFDELATVG